MTFYYEYEPDELRVGRFGVNSLLFAGLFSSSAGHLPAAPAEPDIRRDAVVVATERVMPTVVNIATKNLVPVRDPMDEVLRQFWGPYYKSRAPDEPFSLGSGVVIDEAGYLLTNDHVVRRADQIYVKLSTGTNIYLATLIASDPNTDVALLKIAAAPGETFQAIQFAKEDDLLLGETVLALGNPFGLGGSVSRGILSSKSRVIPQEGAPLNIRHCLQTDAPINPGNSGGPLVNLRGELIGINVQYVPGGQSIGFAVPIRQVLESMAGFFPTEFVASHWFGARVQVASLPPVTITSVDAGSPAERAGFRAGDVVLQVNGRAPRGLIDFSDMLVAGAESEVRFAVQRGAERRSLSARMVPAASVFNADMIRRKTGLGVEVVSAQEIGLYFGFNASRGFVITGVEKGGAAEAAGLRNRMLIRSVDEQVPADVSGLARLLYLKKKGERVRLDIAVREEWAGGFRVLGQVVELTVS